MTIDFLSRLKMITGEESVLINEPMSAHTTFRIGGSADILAIPPSENALIGIVNLCNEYGFHYLILGNGSNLLVSDNGIEGVVIDTQQLAKVTVCGLEIEAQCGATLARVSSYALKNELSGIEFASGIPGTLGGAVYMNAGAYGEEMKDIIFTVKFLDSIGNIKEFTEDDCCFGYRSSFFQSNSGVVLSAKMLLKKGEVENISQKCKELNAKRREKQPLEMPSAGSVFKRPEGHFAGTLIEQAGLKGFKMGGAMVSEKHAGFIVNAGGATAKDVLSLVEHIKKTVKDQTGVELHEEIRLIGRA